MSRDDLIARKEAVRAEIARARRTLERVRGEAEGASGLRGRFLAQRAAQLESQLDALMAEEYRLRLGIDRSERV